jgi:hypothetical protein
LNATISEFFTGTIGASSLSWLPLLKQYWNKFVNWLPKIDDVILSVTERSPPRPDAMGWWAVISHGSNFVVFDPIVLFHSQCGERFARGELKLDDLTHFAEPGNEGVATVRRRAGA